MTVVLLLSLGSDSAVLAGCIGPASLARIVVSVEHHVVLHVVEVDLQKNQKNLVTYCLELLVFEQAAASHTDLMHCGSFLWITRASVVKTVAGTQSSTWSLKSTGMRRLHATA